MSTETNHQSNNETWVLVCTVLASAMAFIDATALNVALPEIQSQVGATGSELFWIVNSYAVVTAALILFGGALGDGFGRKRVFGIGIGLFTLASLGCGLSQSIQTLIATRAIQGFGAALMIPGSLSLISSTFSASRRGRAIGVWSACSVVMTAVGPIVGGLFADAGWWQAIFLINLPIGCLSLGVLLTKVTVDEHVVPDESDVERGGSPRKIDIAGAVFSILGLAGINVALLEVAVRGWTDVFVVSALILGVFFLGLFLWNESRSASPLLPLELFRIRNFNIASQMTVCFYSGVYGMLFFLALNLIQVQDYKAMIAGAAQLPVMILVILLSPLAGHLVDRYGPRMPMLAGGVLATLGFLLLARPGVTSGPTDYWTTYFPPLLCLGAAMGMSAATLSTTIMNSVGQNRLGIASGINSTLSRLSGVLGIAVLGPIAIVTFRRSLIDRCKSLSIDDQLSANLQRESWRFADAVPPSGISLELTVAIESAIDFAFVDAFRVASIFAAATVGVSTLITALMLEPKNVIR